MIEDIKNINPNNKELKNFSVVIGLLLLILGFFLYYKEDDNFILFFFASAASFILGQIGRTVLKPTYFIWMIFATVVGWFMTRVILVVLFFGIVTPIGLIVRFFNYNNNKKFDEERTKSYWNARDRRKEINQDFEKQF